MSTFKEESKESYNDKPKFAVNAILFIFTLEKFGSSTNFLPSWGRLPSIGWGRGGNIAIAIIYLFMVFHSPL